MTTVTNGPRSRIVCVDRTPGSVSERGRSVIAFSPQNERSAPRRHGFDAAYLAALREGDPDTERHFVAYFAALILIKVRARHYRHLLAEDVKQETLLRALRVLRSSEGLREPGCLGAFVNSICNNVLREFIRSSIRLQPLDEDPCPIPDTATPSQEDRLITEERKRAVRRVIGRLGPRDRDLLRAIFLEERDKDEVCRQFGVDRGYLRVLLHRAKKGFRSLYLEHEEARASARWVCPSSREASSG
jgi:RNA polymerase sigma-70 factor, ECF subfamily